MTIPLKPKEFGPEIPPPGFEKKLISFWADRPRIKPRLQLIHTNGASREGTVDSAFNWANQPGSGHTIPQCQIDRSGRAALLLPSDRKGIANYKAADFSIAFETGDTGYLDDPTVSAFTEKQAEQVAVACAYYSILHSIPLAIPTAWDGSGTASHTDPFGYPYWTNSNGKICPGLKKKAQVRGFIIPRARQIVAAWTAPPPPPPPPPEDDVILYSEIKDLWIAPGASDVADGGSSDRWLNAIVMKVGSIADVQRENGLTVTGRYDAATAAIYSKLLAEMRVKAGA